VSEDLCYLSASELLRRYGEKSLSPVDVTQATLARIERYDGAINAYCLVAEDEALAAARLSEDRWNRGQPLGLVDGVPTSIKDLNAAKGWPLRKGSRTVAADQPSDEDTPMVARLREQGAVFLGKTTTPEFGWKGITDSPLTGITRNPWNTECTPGGSSGGAAAALAAGFCALATGGDGGGSIRIPSGFSGTFGIKAQFGRVPAYPASPYNTLSHPGPMARTVEDAALMLTVVTQPDARDWLALEYHGSDWRDGLDDGVAGLRIGFSPDLGYGRVDAQVADRVAKAAQALAELGAHVEEVAPPFADPTEAFRTIWWVASANAMRDFSPAQMAELEPDLADICEQGRRIDLIEYLRAVDCRAEVGLAMKTFGQTYDLLLTPSLAVPAFAAGKLSPWPDDGFKWLSWTPFSYPFNMTGQPAASVPCGFTDEGLPVGLQIVGRAYEEATVLRAARAYETAHPFHLQRPSLAEPE
jgi:aspartyl-tRNA(Asn)/glutamyl-tRNA(Gln) amidotransferase subunit A